VAKALLVGDFFAFIENIPLYYPYLIILWRMGMKAVNVSSLKNNPSEALRYAREDMVLVMNRDQPDVLMIGLNRVGE
jgi:hypothetical protein